MHGCYALVLIDALKQQVVADTSNLGLPKVRFVE
jgi:hypothetical protein